MRLLFSFAFLLFLTACAGGRFHSEQAEGKYLSSPMQCVPFARARSGIDIYGDAHRWWEKAPPRYARGHRPEPGAVLVLARTKKMTHGHLAVVNNVLSDRRIEVAHSNWGDSYSTRRMAYDRMLAEDVSKKNDWSSVRFWNYELGQFGFPYRAKGFIYK